MSLEFCPIRSSVWNPALNFVGSYGLSSTTASALSMNWFWNRSYRRPTMAVSPLERPEEAYDPSAKPVSLIPGIDGSRRFHGAGGAGGGRVIVGLGTGRC